MEPAIFSVTGSRGAIDQGGASCEFRGGATAVVTGGVSAIEDVSLLLLRKSSFAYAVVGVCVGSVNNLEIDNASYYLLKLFSFGRVEARCCPNCKVCSLCLSIPKGPFAKVDEWEEGDQIRLILLRDTK